MNSFWFRRCSHSATENANGLTEAPPLDLSRVFPSVAMPGDSSSDALVPNSFLLLLVRHLLLLAWHLLLVAMPGAPSSVLAPSSDARSP